MKHTPEITHFFLHHLLPISICFAIFLIGIYLVVRDANNVLKDKESKQRLIKHTRKHKK